LRVGSIERYFQFSSAQINATDFERLAGNHVSAKVRRARPNRRVAAALLDTILLLSPQYREDHRR